MPPNAKHQYSKPPAPRPMIDPGREFIRASFTKAGTRIFLVHDHHRHVFRLATRWEWLAELECHDTAHQAFDALKVQSCEECRLVGRMDQIIRGLPAESFSSQFSPGWKPETSDTAVSLLSTRPGILARLTGALSGGIRP